MEPFFTQLMLDQVYHNYLLYYLHFQVEAWGVSFSADGKYVAVTGQSGNISIWNVETGQSHQSLQTNGAFTVSVAFVCILNLNAHIGVESKWTACSLWSYGWWNYFIWHQLFHQTSFYSRLVHSTKILTPQGHSMAVRALTYTKDGALLLSGSDDMHIKLYDTYGLNEFCILIMQCHQQHNNVSHWTWFMGFVPLSQSKWKIICL